MEQPRLAGAQVAASRPFLPSSGRDGRIQGAVLSVALHAALFFVGGLLWVKPISYGVTAGETAVEVELTAAPPAPETAPQPEEQVFESVPEPIVPEPEAIVEQPKAVEKVVVQKPIEKPLPPKPVAPVAGPVGDGSSSVPGKDSVTRRSTGAQIAARPNYLRNPAPRYPEASRRNSEEGLVLLKVDVNPSGRPVQVELSDSSGYERLDRAAVEAVKRWVFEPARLGPLPVASTVQVPVRFRLSDRRA